jgi:mersacidin/lichenicidin family type 2 lantibiotic
MSKLHIIRAWKDETYRNSLSAAQRAALPANPAGAIELTKAELDAVAGGDTTPVCTAAVRVSKSICCTMY